MLAWYTKIKVGVHPVNLFGLQKYSSAVLELKICILRILF